MKKIAMFVFKEDPVCFVHVLLNALDMKEKGYEAKIIMEGSATALIMALAKDKNPLRTLWEKTKKRGLVEGACRACSMKTGSLEAAKAQGLKLLDEMNGHPGMAAYRDAGFEIITF